MPHLALDTVIDGLIRTLRDTVLPAVQERFARGQLFAAIDILHNLRDRIEPLAALATAEADSAAAALREAAAALEGAPRATVEAALIAAPLAPPLARATALRAAVTTTLAVLAQLPAGTAAQARLPLERHLAAQVMRDVMVLKPSLLEEISKG